MSEEIGRKAILAVDREDILTLIWLFHDQKDEYDINTTTTSSGYLAYKWTPWIAQFLGDTLLHIALKKMKFKSVNTLLLLNARIDTQNYFKETTDSICQLKFGNSIRTMKYNAISNLLPYIRLQDLDRLSCILPISSLHRETLSLIGNGRLNSCSSTHGNMIEIISCVRAYSLQKKKQLSTSTNLRYISWNTNEIQNLANALMNDEMITSLTLSSIHLNSSKIVILLPALITMFRLEYLDLSQNCLTDEDANILASGLIDRSVESSSLRINLMGNRLTSIGARKIISSLDGRCSYIKFEFIILFIVS